LSATIILKFSDDSKSYLEITIELLIIEKNIFAKTKCRLKLKRQNMIFYQEFVKIIISIVLIALKMIFISSHNSINTHILISL
jgi:hypothetical protein